MFSLQMKRVLQGGVNCNTKQQYRGSSVDITQYFAFCLSGWLYAQVGAVHTTTLFPLPFFPDEGTTGVSDKILQQWKKTKQCKSKDVTGRCVPQKGTMWGPTEEQKFVMSIQDMSEGIRTYLQK